MGSWGFHYRESDIFFNIFAKCLKPITDILDSKHSDDWLVKNEKEIIAASGLLYDIMANERLYYKNEEELIEKAIIKLKKIIELCDFKDWDRPELRKAHVNRLLFNLKIRFKNKKPRKTTLEVKLLKEQEDLNERRRKKK